jgi:hypothetical protein
MPVLDSTLSINAAKMGSRTMVAAHKIALASVVWWFFLIFLSSL